VRAPGSKRDGLGGGLVGDAVCDRDNHGGDVQAVYAYAREDLDHWESVLGRALPGGVFGENLTTTGVDVNGAVIGERWRIGDALELAVTVPRIPCGTFRGWIAERGWLRTFTKAALPGTYLSVVSPGQVRAGDPLTIVHRPAHGVTVAQVFRAITLEPELLPSILAADELHEETKEMARTGRTFSPG
jgi:MOSC domain-containing protein YiiM